MTKSAKHKKEFRREKNKVKLKLSFKAEKNGKKKRGQLLPKGLNVTDTSFKSKKILIPGFLSPTIEDSGKSVTHAKQMFKELLSCMGHFNANVQRDGVLGMKELLMKCPEISEVLLSSLLGKLSELMTAFDATVRKFSLRLLEHIIQSTPAENITPFFPLLSAQLICCMNHISRDIQKDSHYFLDILLSNVPCLVATVTLQILPNFLDQVSSRDDSRKGKRILTIDPSQGLPSMKWRQEILIRIDRLLTLLLRERMSDSQQIHSPTTFIAGKPCPLYFKRSFNIKLNFQKLDYFVVINKTTSCCLQEFFSHIIPLLIETWVEAMASEQTDNQGYSLIGIESINVLTCITNLMFTLLNIVKQSENYSKLLSWFDREYGELFIRSFIRQFPYSVRQESVKSKKNAVDPQCRKQNLILCFVWAQLEMKCATKYGEQIFQYLSVQYTSRKQLNCMIENLIKSVY